jgi:nitrogen fixation protein FixH
MKREHLWPLAISAILIGTVAVNFWVMHVASADPSFSIEPNYYARAISWDSTVAQQEQNRTLGWRLTPTLSRYDEDGAILRVSLTDSSGRAITHARVRVAALFIARANDVFDVHLEPDGDDYAVRLPVKHRGEWELRFTVQDGTQRFTSTQRIDAEPVTVRGT